MKTINNKSARKVLIIDDEDIISGMIKDVLELNGYDVMIANSGREGLVRAREFKPDIITLDLNMPGMDGFEVLENLKSHKVTKNIPVLISSVRKRKIDFKRGRELGARDYFVKPFSINSFEEEINKCLAV